MPEMLAERRANRRHGYRAKLRCTGASVQPAQSLDLSEMGLCIATSDAIDPGGELDLHLLNGNVRVAGVAQSCDPMNHGGYRVGIAFLLPQPDLVQVLLAAQGNGQS